MQKQDELAHAKQLLEEARVMLRNLQKLYEPPKETALMVERIALFLKR